MAVAAEGLLLKRLQRVLGQWPTDASRKGRDLGEFLSQRYKAKFQEEILSDSVKANEVVESLENLNCDHYRKLYRRKTEYSFCGDQVTEVTSQILSTENQTKIRKDSRTWLDKIFGRSSSFEK